MANLIFPLNTRNLMNSWGLSENDIHDVFTNREHVKTSKGSDAARKYYSSYGYEIWATYKQSQYGEGYIITWVNHNHVN